MTPTYLLVAPTHYDVSYAINPWMKPGIWSENPHKHLAEAQASFAALAQALQASGGSTQIVQGVAGQPDMVFPANAGIVLDRKALVAAFRHPQRQGEEAPFRAIFEDLRDRGLIDSVATLPHGVFQEGAGDCIWDRTRGIAWAGYGPRSSPDAPGVVADVFGIETVPLELATERFYHLDTCFCVLPGGEVLFYPPAFTQEGQDAIRARVSPELLIEAADEDAGRFCVNAVALDRTIVMAEATPELKARLATHGYAVREVSLAPFILSGGGAYCMSLRLDLSTRSA
jgi:N-dimethylarginine dimethylaminohydrolase